MKPSQHKFLPREDTINPYSMRIDPNRTTNEPYQTTIDHNRMTIDQFRMSIDPKKMLIKKLFFIKLHAPSHFFQQLYLNGQGTIILTI